MPSLQFHFVWFPPLLTKVQPHWSSFSQIWPHLFLTQGLCIILPVCLNLNPPDLLMACVLTSPPNRSWNELLPLDLNVTRSCSSYGSYFKNHLLRKASFDCPIYSNFSLHSTHIKSQLLVIELPFNYHYITYIWNSLAYWFVIYCLPNPLLECVLHEDRNCLPC